MSDMSDQGSDPQPHATGKTAAKKEEPFWVDVMKSIGCGLTLLLLTIIVGGALGIAIMAPWGRASFDCSIYCVIREYFQSFF